MYNVCECVHTLSDVVSEEAVVDLGTLVLTHGQRLFVRLCPSSEELSNQQCPGALRLYPFCCGLMEWPAAQHPGI